MENEKLNINSPHLRFEVRLLNGSTKEVTKTDLPKYLQNFRDALPELNGRKTWVSNYVATFWMPLMKPTAFALYFQVLKMAYGDKDYSFPSVPYLAMLTGISESTVQRHMKILEDLQFVNVLEAYDKRTGKQLPNFYLLSNTIPYISKKQYEELPKRLQEEHDEFLRYVQFRTTMTSSELPDYNGER